MFPNEFELQIRQQELLRAAENYRLARLAQTVPTLWERIRARLTARPTVRPAFSSQSHTQPDVIVLSR